MYTVPHTGPELNLGTAVRWSLSMSVRQERVLMTVFRALSIFFSGLSLSLWWVAVSCFVHRRPGQPAQQLANFPSAFIQTSSSCPLKTAGNRSDMRADLFGNAVLTLLPWASSI